MPLKMPNSTTECVYFTNRTLDPNGKVIAWVYRVACPKCKKGLMGKPVEKGKIKIRSPNYVCSSCGHEEEVDSFSETLTIEAMYTCPHCKKSGESTAPYKLKTINGIKTYRLLCQHCKGFIDVTKKMKEKGSKGDD